MLSHISPRDFELLSAYLDGQLHGAARQRLEARLGQDAALRQEYEDLRRMRIVLRSLPHARPPRNFTLTPQVAGQPARQRAGARLYPLMGFASAFASLLLVLVLLGDLFGVLPGVNPAQSPVTAYEALDFPTAVAMQPGIQEKAAAPTEEISVEAFSALAEASPTTGGPAFEMRLTPTEAVSEVLQSAPTTGIAQGAPEAPPTEETAPLELAMPSESGAALVTETPLPFGGGIPSDNPAAKQVVEGTPTPTLTFTPTPVPTETPVPSPTSLLPTLVEPTAVESLPLPSPTLEILALAPPQEVPAGAGEAEVGDLSQGAPVVQSDFLPEPAPSPSRGPARLLWWGVQIVLLGAAAITGVVALILRFKER